MATIRKGKDAQGNAVKPSPFEEKVANELFNLRSAPANEDIKAQLESLYILSATQIKMENGKVLSALLELFFG